MPQVIVIDEIGTKLEAVAASTIAQRGIQLVATAHGVTIDNLVMNPALDMLVGGVQVQFNLQLCFCQREHLSLSLYLRLCVCVLGRSGGLAMYNY